jgi:Flp pilus assembly protein TadG
MRTPRRGLSGQTMVEFAMVFPVFLLLVMSTIDFGGYFSSRLSVEQAARAGARAAVVQLANSYSGSAITTAISGQQGMAALTTTADCLWQGTTLDPDKYPPFIPTGTSTSCVGVWYFDLMNETTGPPALCTQWSVAHSQFGLYSGNAWTAATPPSGCVVPQEDLVVVGVGYQYKPLTPMPAIVAAALTTYGETQLIEEGST